MRDWADLSYATRRAIHGIAAMLLFGVLLATLTPMPYHRYPPNVPLLEGYRYIMMGPMSGVDIVGNVILFCPVGAVMWVITAIHIRHSVGRLLIVMIGGPLLSLAIEWAQVFIRGRYPSIIDIGMNSVGALFGMISMIIVSYAVRGLLKSGPNRGSFMHAPQDAPDHRAAA